MDTAIKFLYLSEPDMIKVGATDMAACVDTMEDMFRLLSEGDYQMGGKNGNSHGIWMGFPDNPKFPNMPKNGPDRRFTAMPAYLGGKFDMAGVKWYGSNVENREKGLPRSILMLVLNDKDTGAPKAFMSANLISSYRTGAVPGVGAKNLARKDASTVGIIGPGVMNKTAMEAFMVTCPNICRVKIKGRGKKSLDSFVDFLKEKFPRITDIQIVDTMEDAVRECDIVSMAMPCAMGSASYPYIKEEWIKPGALLCLPGSSRFDEDFMRERAKLVTDNVHLYESWQDEFPAPAYESAGIICTKWCDMVLDHTLDPKKIENIGDILTGKVPGRKDDDEIIIFSIGGMPVEDVAWGTVLYENALKKGVGTMLPLWDSPYLA